MRHGVVKPQKPYQKQQQGFYDEYDCDLFFHGHQPTCVTSTNRSETNLMAT